VTWVGQEEEGADSAGAEEVRVSQKPKGLQLILFLALTSSVMLSLGLMAG
jgi:hypothetical protein